MYRVYYNRKDNPDQVWSLDCGPGTAEEFYREIEIKAHCVTRFDGSGDNNKTPRAWLQVDGGKISVPYKGKITIFPLPI